jgi:Skp family chaperone for outer membrane proteins
VKRIFFYFAVAVATLAGCATQTDSSVATIDLTRIQNNWPKFINYSNQLASDTASIQRSAGSQQQKARELDELRRRYVSMQNEVSGDVRDAAAKVADARHIKLVVTRQFVGYGGVDITPDVEKLLNITEASPVKS